MWVQSVGQKIPWRRKWQRTLVLLPGKIPWTEEPGGLESMGWKKSQTWLKRLDKNNKMQIQFEKCSHLASIHFKVEETDLWISPEISVDRSGREKKIKEYYGGQEEYCGVRRESRWGDEGEWTTKRKLLSYTNNFPLLPFHFPVSFPPSILHLKHSFPNEGDNRVHIFRVVKFKRHQDRQFSVHSFQVF